MGCGRVFRLGNYHLRNDEGFFHCAIGVITY